MPEPTTEDLVVLVAGGDRDALSALYDRHGDAAYRVAVHVAGDERLAEDAVHGAFLTVWRAAPGYDPRRLPAEAWLMMLVHRRAVDLSRRTVGRRAAKPKRAPQSPEQARVRRALDALPAAELRTLELAYYGGLTQSEIALALDEPLATIATRTASALTRLAAVLAAA